MEQEEGTYLVCRLTSAADKEYATRAAYDLVRDKLTLLPTACGNQIGERSVTSGSGLAMCILQILEGLVAK